MYLVVKRSLLGKMEKLYKTPYEKEYSEIYNDIYLLDETHLQHTQYEINLIETLCKDKQSWLDVACGTGYHLNNAGRSRRASSSNLCARTGRTVVSTTTGPDSAS